jgi:hypothetical protein
MSPTLAHIGGLPVEEAVASFGPALLAAFGAAAARLRARLLRTRSRAASQGAARAGTSAVSGPHAEDAAGG